MVKEDFPALRGIVYLDNAATTQKPLSVIEAITEYYERYNANVHRGIYPLARKATELYEGARKKVAEFIGGRYEEVVFVRNTTEGLNLAAHVVSSVCEGSNLVVSLWEHHSNLLPWWRLAREKGWELRVVRPLPDGSPDLEKLVEMVDEDTSVVAIQHASNVTGQTVDLQKVTGIAKEYGALVVVDGAQSVPHMPVNVKNLGIDALAFSGHKMLGPMGIGVLWMKKELLEEAEPFLLGGDMVKAVHFSEDIEPVWNDVPWKFEAGTPNVAGAIGLAEAVRYLEGFGMERILPHERKLARAILEYVEDMGFRVIGGEERGGIVAFWREDVDPHLLAMKLGKRGVCVRSGFHCAQPLHEAVGANKGSIRASLYLYNDEDDVERFAEVLGEVL